MLCYVTCQYDISPIGGILSWSVVFSRYSNKTDRHDIAEILLKVALNTITLTP
jgi:hypothetical protein